ESTLTVHFIIKAGRLAVDQDPREHIFTPTDTFKQLAGASLKKHNDSFDAERTKVLLLKDLSDSLAQLQQFVQYSQGSNPKVLTNISPDLTGTPNSWEAYEQAFQNWTSVNHSKLDATFKECVRELAKKIPANTALAYSVNDKTNLTIGKPTRYNVLFRV